MRLNRARRIRGAGRHMNMAADKNPRLEGFGIEDAAAVRRHDPAIDVILSYFDEKTEGNRMPRRSDLNPMELKEQLPEIGMFEPIYDADGKMVDAQIILLGSRIDDFYGHMTGKRVTEFPHAQVAVRIIQACRQCIEHKAPVVVKAESLSDSKDFVAITVLYVPMSGDGLHVDRIFLYNQIKSKFSQHKKS